MTRELFACRCGKCRGSLRPDGSYVDIPIDLTLVHELSLIARCVPVIVLSGYRCQDYDRYCAKTERTTAHTRGEAADITTTADMHKLFLLCCSCSKFSVVIKHQHYIHVSVEHRKVRFIHDVEEETTTTGVN